MRLASQQVAGQRARQFARGDIAKIARRDYLSHTDSLLSAAKIMPAMTGAAHENAAIAAQIASTAGRGPA